MAIDFNKGKAADEGIKWLIDLAIGLVTAPFKGLIGTIDSFSDSFKGFQEFLKRIEVKSPELDPLLAQAPEVLASTKDGIAKVQALVQSGVTSTVADASRQVVKDNLGIDVPEPSSPLTPGLQPAPVAGQSK